MRIPFQKAVELLNSHQVVAIPTETVYGLAASLFSEAAIDKVFSIKGRPSQNPLIIHVDSSDLLQPFVNTFPPHFHKLIDAFWPGPLTVVIEIIPKSILPKVTAGLTTAAFRSPAHPLTQKLLKETGPLVAPSANLSGKPSPTSADHVEYDLGFDFPVLEGGICENGVESTILFFDQLEWKIIRMGALSPEQFTPILGYQPSVQLGDGNPNPLCPGQLFRHYAPQAKLILTGDPDPNIPIIGFSDRTYPSGSFVIYLGNSEDATLAAHNLYDVLRKLDLQQIKKAWIDMAFPASGLWLTIRERILKAATES